jgi:hypothetical protein
VCRFGGRWRGKEAHRAAAGFSFVEADSVEGKPTRGVWFEGATWREQGVWRVLGGACRQWRSRAGSGAAEVGAVRRHVRQGSGERKGVLARGPLWAGWRSQPKMNSDTL